MSGRSGRARSTVAARGALHLSVRPVMMGPVMTRWTQQAVERAAPDASSLTAARRLAAPGPWSDTGATDTLLYGRCQGSGRTPYQVSIDLTGPAYRCSCPSRKFPCKHALALLLLWVRGDGAGVDDQADGARDGAGALAAEWAAQRAGRAATQAVAAARAPVDPEARAKRQAERARLMDAGIEDFALWLTDLVRGGTAAARRQPFTWWDAAGGRLVDAQLPGLAQHVRDTGAALAARADWADVLVSELGRWWTVVQAWRRRADLDPATFADLRATVGWGTQSEEVRGVDEVVDAWQVMGAHRTDDGRLLQQRTWLRGMTTGEHLVVLDFTAGDRPLPAARLVSSVLDGPVSRYPGSAPRRALLADDLVVTGTGAPLPPGIGVEAGLDLLAEAWGHNPWLSRVPVTLGPVALSADQRLVRDTDGASVPLLLTDDVWSLLALTGGREVTVFGELEAAGFRPLTLDLDEAGECR